MGFDFLKLNSSTVIPVDVLVSGVPRDQGVSPPTAVVQSEWFRDRHFQELLALLRTHLPPSSSFQKCPAGDVDGTEFSFSWKLQTWPLAPLTVLRKTAASRPAQDVQAAGGCRLKQPRLPWLLSSDGEGLAERDNAAEATGVIRFRSLHSLPFVIHILARQRLTEKTVPLQPLIPITAFFDPSSVNDEGVRKSFSPEEAGGVVLGTTHAVNQQSTLHTPVAALSVTNPVKSVATGPAGTVDMADKKLMKRGDPSQTRVRMKGSPLSSPAECAKKLSVTRQELNTYRRKLHVNQLSAVDGMAVFRETCAAMAGTAAAGKQSPLTPLSPPATASQVGRSKAPVNAAVVAAVLSSPSPKSKVVDWEGLYKPTVGEIETLDDHEGRSKLQAACSSMLSCWKCGMKFATSPSNDILNCCSPCAKSTRPEIRCKVSEQSPKISSSPTKPALLRRSTVCTPDSTAEISPRGSAFACPPPLLRRHTVCTSGSTAEISPRGSASSCPSPSARAGVGRGLLKRSASLCEALDMPPPKVARSDGTAASEDPLLLHDDFLQGHESPLPAKVCYGGRRLSRNSSDNSITLFRDRSTCQSDRRTAAVSPSGADDKRLAQASDSRSRPAMLPLASGLASARSEAPSHVDQTACNAQAQNARLGRVMEMSPTTGLDESLMPSFPGQASPSTPADDELRHGVALSPGGSGTADRDEATLDQHSASEQDHCAGGVTLLPYSPSEPGDGGGDDVSVSGDTQPLDSAAVDSDSNVSLPRTGIGLCHSRVPLRRPHRPDSPTHLPLAVEAPQRWTEPVARRDSPDMPLSPITSGLSLSPSDYAPPPEVALLSEPPSPEQARPEVVLSSSDNEVPTTREYDQSRPEHGEDNSHSQEEDRLCSSPPAAVASRYFHSASGRVAAKPSVHPKLSSQPFTPSTRMRSRMRLQRPNTFKKLASGRALANSGSSHSSNLAATSASSTNVAAGICDNQSVFDYPAGSPESDGLCNTVPERVSDSAPEDQDHIVISDGSDSDGGINAAASLENITRRQLQRRVVLLRPHLKSIFSGNCYNKRHETYKTGGKAAKKMAQQHSLVSSTQQEAVARVLVMMFCKKDVGMQFYDYTMRVLLPECLILLVMDLTKCSEEVARRTLISN